jgi:hypothetical protein
MFQIVSPQKFHLYSLFHQSDLQTDWFLYCTSKSKPGKTKEKQQIPPSEWLVPIQELNQELPKVTAM